MIFAKRISSPKIKTKFAERITLKNCQLIELVHSTKTSVISRHEYTINSEQTISAIRLANQLTYAVHDFCTTERTHCNPVLEKCIKGRASKAGLIAALELNLWLRFWFNFQYLIETVFLNVFS